MIRVWRGSRGSRSELTSLANARKTYNHPCEFWLFQVWRNSLSRNFLILDWVFDMAMERAGSVFILFKLFKLQTCLSLFYHRCFSLLVAATPMPEVCYLTLTVTAHFSLCLTEQFDHQRTIPMLARYHRRWCYFPWLTYRRPIGSLQT
jgi:hypothetical protein